MKKIKNAAAAKKIVCSNPKKIEKKGKKIFFADEPQLGKKK